MTNSMFNPPPCYSGVTIQIANPAVNVGQPGVYGNNSVTASCGTNSVSSAYPANCNGSECLASGETQTANPTVQNYSTVPPTIQTGSQTYPAQAYPAQYYLNNYNYQNNGKDERKISKNGEFDESENSSGDIPDFINKSDINPENGTSYSNGINTYKQFADENTKDAQDFSKSTDIIQGLDERQAEIENAKKNTTETKIVALTDEYIKSLENYLDNPNDEIRLMASKEILTRLDEDKDRFDDAALNALLNKMMQDPSKLVRIAALSAFSSGLASGNDYTVKLLHNIQSNPNADKEDVLQAADILLRMTSGTEIKNIPNPSVKETNKDSK